MNEFKFWENWEKPFRVFYQVLLAFFAISLIAYLVAYFLGPSLAIHWDLHSSTSSVKTVFDRYSVGLYEFPIKIDNLVITQYFQATDLLLRAWPAYLLLGIVAVGLVILLALTADLSLYWYGFAMALFLGALVLFKLESLLLFGQYNKIALAIALVLYLPVSYYFHLNSDRYAFFFRLAAFALITLVFGGVITFYAEAPKPFLQLASLGFYVPLLLAIVFIFMVGHEVISTLLQVITNSAPSKNGRNLFHFVIISAIYLLNIVLVYLRNNRAVPMKIYLIDSFMLLVIAGILGIWGYRKREVAYGNTFSFYPQGAVLYLVLGIIAFSTISFCFVTANDDMLDTLADAVAFSQLGYGAMFLFYVIVNFPDLLYQNKNVGKVVYRPLRMPYFTARFAGIIVVLALFFVDHKRAYYHARAGFYTGVADMYAMNSDYLSAREYYKLAEVYIASSHRANYAMASLEKNNNNFNQALESLKNAVAANPTEYAFVNLANAYMRNNAYFDAIFTLNEGLQKFPRSGPIWNNLGVLYTKTGALDSTYQCFQSALKINKSHDAATANIFSFLNTKKLSIKKDTLEQLFKKIDYLPADNNLVVLANGLGIPAKDPHSIRFDQKDTSDLVRIVYNYNKMLNQPEKVDTAMLNSFDGFFGESPFYWMHEPLKIAGAFANYKNHRVTAAFNTLNNMQSGDDPQAVQDASYLGKMSLALKAPRLAIDYLNKSMDGGHVTDAPELAFAYMENGDLDKAAFLWRQIANNNTDNYGSLANDMITVLSINNVRQALALNENLRYHFVHFRYPEFNLDEIQGLILSFDNDNYRAKAMLDIANMFLRTGQTGKASDEINKLGKINISSPAVYQDYLKTTVDFAIETKDHDLLGKLLQDKIMKNPAMQEYAQLAQAVLDQFNGNFSVAETAFKALGHRNPFFVKGVETSVGYFNQNNKDIQEAYNILLNAVNINRYSVPINEAYILQCLKMGLTDYAQESLDNLQQFVDPRTFERFQAYYNKTYSEMKAKKEAW